MNSILTSMEYSVQTPLQKLNPTALGKIHYLLLSLSLFISFALYLHYTLVRFRKAYIIGLVFTGLSLIILNLLSLYFAMDLPKYLATAAAIIYPSLAGVVVLNVRAGNPQRHFLPTIIQSLAIFLGISTVGSYIITTTLSDIRYTMNLKTFEAVQAAYLIPLLLFSVSFIFFYSDFKNIEFRSLWLSILKKFNWKTLIALFMSIIILYIYVSRSGNDSLIPASGLELNLRDWLEDIFLVRPRFKEFLIGYPCLFAFVYLAMRHRNKLQLLPIGLGMVMGSISIVNSFCHVFTSVVVSAQRTMNGLILGIITGSLTVFLLLSAKAKAMM